MSSMNPVHVGRAPRSAQAVRFGRKQLPVVWRREDPLETSVSIQTDRRMRPARPGWSRRLCTASTSRSGSCLGFTVLTRSQPAGAPFIS